MPGYNEWDSGGISYDFFRSLIDARRQGQGRVVDPYGYADSGALSNELENILANSRGMDSGAIGDRVKNLAERFRGGRVALMENRISALDRRGDGPAPVVQQVAAQVGETQLASEAARQLDKRIYKLYRPIPLIAPASRADAAVVAINVTPTNKAFATHISVVGVFRLDALVINGQSLLPNGAVDTSMWAGVSNINIPLNIKLNTVPITGQGTNNTGGALYMAITLHTWMMDDEASERY